MRRTHATLQPPTAAAAGPAAAAPEGGSTGEGGAEVVVLESQGLESSAEATLELAPVWQALRRASRRPLAALEVWPPCFFLFGAVANAWLLQVYLLPTCTYLGK